MGTKPARYLADLAEAIRKSQEYEDPMASTPEIYSQQQILTVYSSPFPALVSSLQQERQVGITQPPTSLLPNIHSKIMSSRPIILEQSSLLPLRSSSVGKVTNSIPFEPITPQTPPLLSMAQGNDLTTCSISPNDIANIQNNASSTGFFAKKENDTVGLIGLSTSNRMAVPGVECGSATEHKGKNKVRLPMIDNRRKSNVLGICDRFEALEALKKRKHYHVYEGEGGLRTDYNNNNIYKKSNN